MKRLGISWYWIRGKAGRGYDWVKVIFAVGGYCVTFPVAPRHRIKGQRRGFFRNRGEEVITKSGAEDRGAFSPRAHVLSEECRRKITKHVRTLSEGFREVNIGAYFLY